MLKQLCEQNLLASLTTDNAADLLYLAELHSAVKLKTACLELIRNNLIEVMATDGWIKVSVLVGQELGKRKEVNNNNSSKKPPQKKRRAK